MNISDLISARQVQFPFSNNDNTQCVWLFTTLNNTGRIELSLNNFGAAKDDNLLIGTDHNFNDDDSIFIKLKGIGHTFAIVSSGYKLWMRYSMAVVTGNDTRSTAFSIYGDIYESESKTLNVCVWGCVGCVCFHG